jgi:hypothetical protein
MHTTCSDQHWSYSGVSKIADETALLPSVSPIWGGGQALVYAPMSPVVIGSPSYLVVCQANILYLGLPIYIFSDLLILTHFI